MSRTSQEAKIISYESKLMKRILEVRYTDLEEEKKLCKQLLYVSEAEQYMYGSAFANVYLMDSHLALGEYYSCDFYLLRASFLCQEYSFDDLMLILCNCAGLYYQKLNDDQTALSYFLKGEKIAENLGDISMKAKLYNNIGYSFGCKEDWATARTYFQMAYETVEPHLVGDNIQNSVSYLSNLAEACGYLGDANGAKQALERCESFSEDSVYSRVRLGCSWCTYYTLINDRDHCVAEADRLIESELLTVEDQFFICDMAEGLCSNMLNIGDGQRARRLLDILQELEYDTSLSLQYRIQCLRIRYWQEYDGADKLDQAYEDYYDIVRKIIAIEDDTRAQSMLSRIQINQASKEHEHMLKQKKDLENASQLDELTKLYNRRYFNKLISKIGYKENVKTLGIIMLDVDYFKQYNDFYGHFRGDDALKAVAQVLSCNVKEGIYASRYGGDEFICLCVNLSDEEVEAYINQVNTQLREMKMPHEKHLSSDIVTISMGYCNEVYLAGMEWEDIVNLADQALYEVKAGNRGSYARKRMD